MKKFIYIVSSAVLMAACESRTYEEISDTAPITEKITYNKDVKAIIETNCVACHSPGPQALTNYNQVKSNIDNIIDRINRPNGDPGKMPQGGSLSPAQINIITKWKADGLTEN
ncbi:cytochrome c [Chryseobacterium sp. SSA4.19]|uniref:c-type cytochrome n=1 Tax=Chryseobacterium sp. SSA4.19 TaxID=2919915 RepID=UPI001F4EB5DF|nr:cytochrome c [Chryseobacterium sp. SSA4.19]MCJ8155404.1 cytochrome c [Chryseobacterium sp. SSA4.19]